MRKSSKVKEDPRKHDLWVQINDYGYGADPKEVQRILSPFFQIVQVLDINKLRKP